MKDPIQDYHEPSSRAEYALAMALYSGEQEKMKSMIQEVLSKYGKPKMTLRELRAALDTQLGSISLSHEVVRMRDEGF